MNHLAGAAQGREPGVLLARGCGGVGDNVAEGDPGEQRVKASAVVRREHHAMVTGLTLDQRHLDKLVLVRQWSEMRRRGRVRIERVEAGKAGLQLASPFHAGSCKRWIRAA